MNDKLKQAWDVAGWISMALIVLGYYFNANQNPACWVIWFSGNVVMGAYCCVKKTYPPAILSFLIAVMNIYGYLSWT